AMSFVAWDTTRLMGFGFLGMMIAVSILLHETGKWQGFRYAILSIIFLANILCPAYEVISLFPNSISGYFYPCLYLLIHTSFSPFKRERGIAKERSFCLFYGPHDRSVGAGSHRRYESQES